MKKLIQTLKSLNTQGTNLPFAVYTCKQNQFLRNIPILKPVLVVILEGTKEIVQEKNLISTQGQFLFLAGNNEVTLNNITHKGSYMSLMIEFEQSDFDILTQPSTTNKTSCVGSQTETLITCLTQYIQWKPSLAKEILKLRRKELLMLLSLQGYSDIASMRETLNTTNTLIDMFKEDIGTRWAIKDVCHKLSTSESTLRRQLRSENASFNDIQNQVKLGYGIHLIQTTKLPILTIAEQCGYQSQSRFTESFKKRFGITPLKLRKTHLCVFR